MSLDTASNSTSQDFCKRLKFQPIDMVDVILRLVLRPRVVYQREIRGSAALNIGGQLSTTKSDGM
jgi:hypothetical protein